MARKGVAPSFEDFALGDVHRDELAQALPEWVKARQGWIYVASNDSWPGIYKIGCTRRGIPQRMQALSGTSVLTPWVPTASWAVYDAYGLEAAAHATCGPWHQRAELFSGPGQHLAALIRTSLIADKQQLLLHLAPVLLPGELHRLLHIEQVQRPPRN